MLLNFVLTNLPFYNTQKKNKYIEFLAILKKQFTYLQCSITQH
uniref:Uncharacterized protein n=1 Tax=Human betaherpesvirus 6A TaxID=32603 RepID=A0A2L2Q9F8_9BETA|nr:hypothetical protein [Human betaherpesvirus 6A]AVI07660.1 hypothetical protein [Human betaherpesvirus 6A]AVI07781.1 hypothetical protein [Human betaherpesvirus 6A]AVI07903.1 hypothetical protein [Human betaherpesvirus 6A]AVI08030.1 hypothetical protein [Human betaherpesvirus 6A]